MKTRTKLLASLEIAIVLCSLFLMALPLPAIAAEQTTQKISANTITTASEDDYALGVYGNANEDDTIDMRDLTYVKLIFFGKKPETELADAKYDGKINPLDFIQIKLIIVGKEKELTVIDSCDRIVTVKKPVKKILPFTTASTETSKILKAQDKVVCVSKSIIEKKTFFPELSKLPNVGSYTEPDYEKIFELKPDIVIVYPSYTPKLEKKLEPAGITVVSLDCYKPLTVIDEVKKLGYILDKRDEAEEFADFYKGVLNPIKEKVEKLSEEDKPRVFYHYYKYKTVSKGGIYHGHIATAGGINIAADLPGENIKVDPEWVIVQNSDIIVWHTYPSMASCGYGEDDPSEMKALRDTIMNSELAIVDAVKNERVYLIFAELMYSSRHPVAIVYMAKWFHPELFEDLNPQANHQEYLTRFQGLDIDLDKKGVFVYPPFE